MPITLSMPTALVELAQAPPPVAVDASAFRLPVLEDADRLAGVNHSPIYYTVEKIVSHWQRQPGAPPLERYASPYAQTHGLDRYGTAVLHRSFLAPCSVADLHRDGHVMPNELLAEFFFNTVFQYYVRRCTGLDPNYNYRQLPGLMASLTLFDRNLLLDLCGPLDLAVPETSQDLAPLLACIEALNQANRSWRDNALLKELGIAFMRQKIVVEKLAQAVGKGSTPEQREARHQLTLVRDRLVQDLQTMIFHLMKEGFAAFTVRLKAEGEDRKASRGLCTAEFVPAFLQEPYYKNLTEYLPEYGQATVLVNGVPL